MLTKIVTLSHRIGVRPWRSSSQPGLSSRSLKQSEDFGWSQSRIFLSDSDSGSPTRSFFTSHS